MAEFSGGKRISYHLAEGGDWPGKPEKLGFLVCKKNSIKSVGKKCKM